MATIMARSLAISLAAHGRQVLAMHLSAVQLSAHSSTVGQQRGKLVGGPLCTFHLPVPCRYGYRWTMIVALFLMNAFIFITFFAKNIETLLLGQILCGVSW